MSLASNNHCMTYEGSKTSNKATKNPLDKFIKSPMLSYETTNIKIQCMWPQVRRKGPQT